MSRLVQGLRCVANRSVLAARMAGPRNIFQHRCMHHGLSSTGLIAPSLVKSVQVIPYESSFLHEFLLLTNVLGVIQWLITHYRHNVTVFVFKSVFIVLSIFHRSSSNFPFEIGF